jgi:hypothetical protein
MGSQLIFRPKFTTTHDLLCCNAMMRQPAI